MEIALRDSNKTAYDGIQFWLLDNRNTWARYQDSNSSDSFGLKLFSALEISFIEMKKE
jgi:hypothetical protein